MRNITKTIIGSLLIPCAAVSWADASKEVDAIPSEHLTQLCIAALKSETAFQETARKYEISREARNRLVCNEMTVDEFASSYRLTTENTIATVQ